MNCLVIPTIRESYFLKFAERWDLDWKIIVVEDNPECTFQVDKTMLHFSWKEINQILGAKNWIISHRDSSIRSFGFYYASQVLKADYIYTLDDDCYPVEGVKFIEEHQKNLNETSRWTESVPGHRTRGLPYRHKGTLENVNLSVGLWEGVPDFDAVQILAGEKHLELPKTTRVMPKGQYFPMCGMNLCFRNIAAPCFYFTLQGEGYPYRRFDDIWAGIFTKKIFDHLGWHITVGHPFIYHSKASHVFTNLAKEAPGIGFNENFWEIIDGIPLTGTTPAQCMAEIGSGLTSNTDEYLKKLGKAMLIWAGLFESV